LSTQTTQAPKPQQQQQQQQQQQSYQSQSKRREMSTEENNDNKKKRLGAYWQKASDVGPVNCYWFKMDVKDVTDPLSE
jgi:hypothetical protein